MQTFHCRQCGLCCKQTPITILPHEALVLSALSREQGISIPIDPGFTIVDTQHNLRITLSYILKPVGGSCPFLNGEKCSIHDVYKPLICRSFPLVPTHIRYFIDTKTLRIVHSSRYGLSTFCPVVKELAKNLSSLYSIESENTSATLIPSTFPDEYEAYYTMEYLRMTYMYALSRLWQSNALGLLVYDRNKRKELPLVNAYTLVKPFIDIAILTVEEPRYIPALCKYLNIRTPKKSSVVNRTTP